MTATNHALTGAVIGLVIANPVALPFAFVSHYVLDIIPHFGWPGNENSRLKGNTFRNYLLIEAVICLILVLLLAITQPISWLLAAVCAFLAAAPDLFSYPRYIKTRKGEPWKPGSYSRFASNIQWFEQPIGAIVELVWLICAISILAIYL